MIASRNATMCNMIYKLSKQKYENLNSSLSVSSNIKWLQIVLDAEQYINMKHPKITQDNVHLLLPNKVARLADRLLQNGVAADVPSALDMVYSSPVYAKMECEATKYWWLALTLYMLI